jgi:hypothetical protein
VAILYWGILSLLISLVFFYFNSFLLATIFFVLFFGAFYYLFTIFTLFHLARLKSSISKYTKSYIRAAFIVFIILVLAGTWKYAGMKGVVNLAGLIVVAVIGQYVWDKIKSHRNRKRTK